MLVARVQSGGDAVKGVSPAENTAHDGEPVIPSFPLGNLSRFLGISSGGYAYEAAVADLAVDPDELGQLLIKAYPGLPPALLTDILVDTLVAAVKATPGCAYRVFVTARNATLQDVKTGDLLPVWKDRNTERYL